MKRAHLARLLVWLAAATAVGATVLVVSLVPWQHLDRDSGEEIQANIEQAPPEVFADPPAEEPADERVLHDAEIEEEEPDLHSDSPFDDKAFNDVIGLGGGAGGKFGGRFGGRRSYRAYGGKARAEGSSREGYDHISENTWVRVADDPLSTFSIDVDTASYANVRRFLRDGQLPPADAVRIEELVNYFRYDYPEPESGSPFSVDLEVAGCPWNGSHRIVRIGLKGRSIDDFERRPSNLVFLLDVSGSMNDAQKLPLLERSFRLLVDALNEKDRVAIVVYAGAAGLVLPSTPASQKGTILAALEELQAGGSTAGGAGLQLAYDTARAAFIEGGTNRVVLATDGDFNVGASSDGELVRMVEEQRESGIALSVLGFGSGNLQDSKMEKLADHGNGNYAYVDSLAEARKVLVQEMGATLETIAKDVKIQVEFNPAQVAAFRLIGYENRKLAHAEFKDDKKDAGEIGAGHTVTALYEVVPAGQPVPGDGDVDPLTYQTPRALSPAAGSGELLTVKLRAKAPDGDVSTERRFPCVDAGYPFQAASPDIKFACAVAAFGMLLRESEQCGAFTLADVGRIARDGVGPDENGCRAELVGLVERAAALRAEREPLAAGDTRD